MSWCRWGSPCQAGWPPNPIDDECPTKTCPGSSIYVYENMQDKFVCCDCSFSKASEDEIAEFSCDTEAEMYKHIIRHDEAGHHVRKSILKKAKEEP